MFFLQPLLIALYPAFYIYLKSLGEASFSDFSLLIFLIFIINTLLYLIFSFLFNSNIKSSIFLMIFYFCNFLFSEIYSRLAEVSVFGLRFFRIRYLLPVSFIFFLYVFIKILKSKNLNKKLAKFLNLPFLVLIFFTTIKMFLYFYEIEKKINSYKASNDFFLVQNFKKLSSKKLKYLPDISFIVLDAYPSGISLKKYFGYNNDLFINTLKQLGFNVFNNSMSNYLTTVKSIPSTMNLNYFDNCDLELRDELYGLAKYMLDNNNAFYYLKMLGYRFYNIDSCWGPAKYLKNSCFKKSYFIPSHLINHYWGMTLFGLFSRYLSEKIQYKMILEQFNSLSSFKKTRFPKFIFSHIYCPHYPFIFKQSGEYTLNNFFSFKHINDSSAFLDQLKFINNKTLTVIENILESSDNKPIIILQGDHGSHIDYVDRRVLKTLDCDDINFIRFANLNAFYLPEINIDDLPNEISPVNNFRFIFNEYFGTDFKFLENKCFK